MSLKKKTNLKIKLYIDVNIKLNGQFVSVIKHDARYPCLPTTMHAMMIDYEWWLEDWR